MMLKIIVFLLIVIAMKILEIGIVIMIVMAGRVFYKSVWILMLAIIIPMQQYQMKALHTN